MQEMFLQLWQSSAEAFGFFLFEELVPAQCCRDTAAINLGCADGQHPAWPQDSPEELTRLLDIHGA